MFLLIRRAMATNATVVKGAFEIKLITIAIFRIACRVATLAATLIDVFTFASAFGAMTDGAFPELGQADFVGRMMAARTRSRRARLIRPRGIGIEAALMRLMIELDRAAFARAFDVERDDRAVVLLHRRSCHGQ